VHPGVPWAVVEKLSGYTAGGDGSVLTGGLPSEQNDKKKPVRRTRTKRPAAQMAEL
jgi:hypothetical protein